jgi:hypothetical protein
VTPAVGADAASVFELRRRRPPFATSGSRASISYIFVCMPLNLRQNCWLLLRRAAEGVLEIDKIV